MENQLKDILSKSPQEWSAEDRNVIARANLTMGRGKVKNIRDDIIANQEQDGSSEN